MKSQPRWVVTLIWGALMFSVVTYAVLAHLLEPAENPDPTLIKILPIIGGAAVAISILLRKFLLLPLRQLSAEQVAGPAASKYLTRHVISYALAESCGVLALVFRLSGGPLQTAQSMLLAALIALVLMKPVAPAIASGRDSTFPR
ncbi:MAG: hypothetical protein KDK99_12225 [Verrucomicrobiales bacterium]|nr:hypothetical protein [Verrucomicrobiales bacterium]